MNRISVIKYVFHAPTGFPTRAACTLREPQLASLNANRTSHRRNIRLKALNLNATLLLLFLATIFILIDHSSLATRFDLLPKYIIFLGHFSSGTHHDEAFGELRERKEAEKNPRPLCPRASSAFGEC